MGAECGRRSDDQNLWNIFSWDTGTWDKSETKLSYKFSTAGQLFAVASRLNPAVNSFPQRRSVFHITESFSLRGTAGQEGLTLAGTTIKCPKKVSHFWDERDTFSGTDGTSGTAG